MSEGRIGKTRTAIVAVPAAKRGCIVMLHQAWVFSEEREGGRESDSWETKENKFGSDCWF